jgi:hypothetical protein
VPPEKSQGIAANTSLSTPSAWPEITAAGSVAKLLRPTSHPAVVALALLHRHGCERLANHSASGVQPWQGSPLVLVHYHPAAWRRLCASLLEAEATGTEGASRREQQRL